MIMLHQMESDFCLNDMYYIKWVIRIALSNALAVCSYWAADILKVISFREKKKSVEQYAEIFRIWDLKIQYQIRRKQQT